jgi:hypothetical protein
MKKLSRVAVAISIFIIGAALIPFVGLPQTGFNWQRFADVYQPMTLDVNFDTGSPGSFFTVHGNNFPPDDAVTILVNGVVLGLVTTDSSGDLTFIIDSGTASPGLYIITTNIIDGPQAIFHLDPADPSRSQEGEGTLFVLPADLASQAIFLPVMHK